MKSPGHVLSLKIRHFFKETGYIVYRHPHLFFWIPIIITVGSVVGFLRFHEENRIWYLYSPTDAPSHYEHQVANEFFNDRGGKFWLEVAVTARDMGNLLRREYLDGIVDLTSYLQYNFTVPCDISISPNGKCSFDTLCTGQCNENTVIPIFNLIYRNSSSRLHPNFRLTYPTMHLYNDEFYVGEHFAGVKIDKNTNRISSVKVIMLYFRTDKLNEEVASTLDRWEKSMFNYASNFSLSHQRLNMTCNSDGMIAQEVRRNGMSCIPYFSISVSIVFCFILLTNRREHFTCDHSIVMALLGVMGPLMAVGTTFCLLALLGVPFNSITLVMPFLIIGVGSDDVFIIIHACKKTDKNAPLEEQIAETMEEAGPSITVTSATNILSFGIGVLTPTPAISIFCLYTAVGVAIDFIYQLTFFVAALVYEEKRQESRRMADEEKPPIKGVTPIKDKEENNNEIEEKAPHHGFISTYTKLLSRWEIRLILFLILCVYWGISLYGCKEMELRMDTTHLVMKSSPLNDVAYVYERFLWTEGQLVMVFVNNVPDLSNPDNQRAMLSLVDSFEKLPYSMGRNSTSFWLRHFLYSATLYHNNYEFYPLLEQWMQDSDGGGARWNDMVRLNRGLNGSVIGVDKFIFATACTMGDDASWNLRANLQHTWRDEAARWTKFNVTVFQSYSFYVDQLDSIGSTTISTVIVAALTMDLACFLMIPSASSIVSSSVAMLSINIGVFGLLSLWGVNLDPISMCTTLMSIGFSVDFTAHISYHYYRNPLSWSCDERLADALKCIGWPMVQAGISTLFCITPLSFIDSYMVRVFVKTLVLVIGLGLLHGIIFLPALLLTVGRSSPDPSKAIHPIDGIPSVETSFNNNSSLEQGKK
ncbi:ptr-16 [Pristionchus pacificus]|nr:ptr-16 [Pristionchus pacificus]